MKYWETSPTLKSSPLAVPFVKSNGSAKPMVQDADDQASQRQMIRIVDESGEDYLYPSGYFAEIEVPEGLQQIFATAS